VLQIYKTFKYFKRKTKLDGKLLKIKTQVINACRKRIVNCAARDRLFEPTETDYFINKARACVVLLYLSRKQSPLLSARNNVTH